MGENDHLALLKQGGSESILNGVPREAEQTIPTQETNSGQETV